MTVRIFGQPLRHRVAGVWPAREKSPTFATRCGLRFSLDPVFYRYSKRVTGSPEPTGRCAECFG